MTQNAIEDGYFFNIPVPIAGYRSLSVSHCLSSPYAIISQHDVLIIICEVLQLLGNETLGCYGFSIDSAKFFNFWTHS
jgi:hypothetical protein